MKPLKYSNWSGRHQSLIPPASLLTTLAAGLAVGFCCVAHSATNTVTSLADNDTGSLRQVIQNSASGDSIIFSVTGTIVLTNGELAVAKNLIIRGPGASALTINAYDRNRILNVSQSATVSISDLTIMSGEAAAGTNGKSGQPGGGIYNAGTLSVRNCVIFANSAGWGGSSGGNGGNGGGIYNRGTLNMSGSTVRYKDPQSVGQ